MSTLDAQISSWLEWDRNPTTKATIQQLKDDGNTEKLSALLSQRMAFGTAGLRAPMGAGFTCMNDLTIIQTTQGLCAYLQKVVGDISLRGAVIGFDKRHNSERFAQLSATVFASQGIKVMAFSEYVPTPFVPFAVKKYNAAIGIMVTASHNPAVDNGYKVYWGNSAQIIPPHDSGIAASILDHLTPTDRAWDVAHPDTLQHISDPYAEVYASYFQTLKTKARSPALNASQDVVSFTYTAMHGVGHKFAKQAFADFGHKAFVPVTSQVEPHPDFPTVAFPNPEEHKVALVLAKETATANKTPIIFANDPDADRLAIGEVTADGTYKCFHGNEIGALFAVWLLKGRDTTRPNSDFYMLNSLVSSKLLQSMCETEGMNFECTLTGFKWIANRAVELELEGKHVLFGFEEAIGFMCETSVLDKDGVSAIAIAAEMVVDAYTRGSTLQEDLDAIYTKYGYFTSNNGHYICKDPVLVDLIFEDVRALDGFHKDAPALPTVAGYKVKRVQDLKRDYDSQPGGNVLPKGGQMMIITFENGAVFTLRTSGTEPKIKYYSELKGDAAHKTTAAEALQTMREAVVGALLRPAHHGLA